MRNLVLGGLVAAAAVAASPASATVVTFQNGQYGVPSYATSTSTRDFNNATNNAAGQYNAATGEMVVGNVFATSGTLTNTSVNPDGGSDRYLAIQNGTYTLTFGSGIQFFSFIAGSIDTYNTLTLNFVGGSSTTLSGAQITTGSTSTNANSFATNGAGNSNVSGRVTYDFQGGAGLLSATFGSTQPTFEIDDIVTAVPEPAAWALMILGFGLVGSQLRTRRRKTTVAFAA